MTIHVYYIHVLVLVHVHVLYIHISFLFLLTGNIYDKYTCTCTYLHVCEHVMWLYIGDNIMHVHVHVKLLYDVHVHV